MKKIVTGFFKPRYLVVLLGVVVSLFLLSAPKLTAFAGQKAPYLIKVNRACNTITVYEQDEKGVYTKPIKAMVCSVGKSNTPTIRGTFQTQAKYRWKELKGDVWGQYATRIVGGILFHSVYYYGIKNPATLATKEFNKLGNAASHGCIRLTVEDSKWIYDNCSLGTTVMIYDDAKNPGPLGKPEPIKIPSTLRWDPTDPNEKNPYFKDQPVIEGAKNLQIDWGEQIDLFNNVKAKSRLGDDLTSKLKVKGKVNIYEPGEYKVTYSVKNDLGKVTKKTIVITVAEMKEPPVLTGIEDRVVNDAMMIDNKFALQGVAAYCNEIKLDQKLIKVKINKSDPTCYEVTYSIKLGKIDTSASAKVVIDNEAPTFSGIMPVLLDEGEVPDLDSALYGVEVNDNYSELDQNDITVTIEQQADGSYLITYEVEDEAGNKASEQVVYSYQVSNVNDVDEITT